MEDRIILHCDLNNFYASVECLYHPELRNGPLAVCGRKDERRGIVLAKNEMAKKFGVKTGEAIWQASQKCPGLVTVEPNFNLYVKFSEEVRKIFVRYTNLVEAFGIDECWLDITNAAKKKGKKNLIEYGEKIAYQIKDSIKEELGITASVGVSFNKIFAKLASDMKKPDAVTVIDSMNFREKIFNLPANDMLFVGRKTFAKMAQIGISTIGDIASCDKQFLKAQFGKSGEQLWEYANGLDCSPVNDVEYIHEVKGLGNSMTMPKDLKTEDEVRIAFYTLAESVGKRLREKGLKARTIQITIKSNLFKYIDRQMSLQIPTYSTDKIAHVAFELFKRNWNFNSDEPVRALGIRTANLNNENEPEQITLFESLVQGERHDTAEKSVDKIREKFGYSSIKRGVLLNMKEKDLDIKTVEESSNFIDWFKK